MDVINPHDYAVQVAGQVIEPGGVVDLPEAAAQSLIAQGWKKKPAPKKAPAKDKE